MAQLSTQRPVLAGLAPAFVAASSGGDEFIPENHQAVYLKNGSGAPTTVTFITPITVEGQGVDDLAVSVPAGADRLVLVSPTLMKNSSGLANITYSAAAGLSLAVIAI